MASQKTILITGCSSGIGRAAAYGLRDRGWRVFASCRKIADCDALKAEGFDAPQIDCADSDSIKAGVAEVLQATGDTLDALFNNAAYGVPGPVEDVPTQALREIFETNFFGVHDLTRRVIPVMRAQGHGRIVQCSSVLGIVAFPWRGAYNSTKFALEGLTDTLRCEMRGTGIEAILIEPGPINTRIRENAIPHFDRWIDWENSARVEEYRESLLEKVYKGSGKVPGELEPDAVVAKLIHAVESPRPRPRYYVTYWTYIGAFLRRTVPTRLLDALLSRA